MVKIYITGCAKSGTTLLTRLFHACESALVCSQEINISDFAKLSSSVSGNGVIVGKRTENSLFSNILSSQEIKAQLKIIEENDIKIINVIRDGRDVVDSWVKSWGIYNPMVWMECIDRANEYKEFIDLEISYEALMEFPDAIQQRITDRLDVKFDHNFSSYPDFVEKGAFLNEGEKYVPRKISPSIGDRKTYLRRPNDIEYFNQLLNQLGYICAE